MKPRIGVTLGDPGSIGPEVLLKALARPPAGAEFLVFGSAKVLKYHANRLKIPFPDRRFTLIDFDNVRNPYFGPRPEISGAAGIDYLKAAFAFFREGKIDGLVTGPIQKESWHICGYRYPGQTEFCAEQTGTREFCMLMASRRFRIALLSTHLSLREALKKVRRPNIVRMIRLIHKEFRRLGFKEPRIGCAALNPHAGESGILGTEERKQIEPAIQELKAQGIRVDAPIAPEVIFRMAAMSKKWDVILSMYHDQAMIPLKLLDFERSANVTLGLPLIRTSPDHGTAFDIAGRGIADPGSMRFAVQLAVNWTRLRMRYANTGA